MKPADPSPEEIAAACLEIQSGWSDEERLRADWRQMVRCADGRLVAVCDYNNRIGNGDSLLQIFLSKIFTQWRDG